ncbi:MAG: DUF748 domain-containing protein [Steroidobacteraceae bacterium]
MIQARVRRLFSWVVLPAVLLVLLYAILGFFAVPRLLRSEAQDFVNRHYHRQVALGEIRFNPFTLRLDLRDFALPDADGQPMLAFRHLLVDLTIASVWRRGPDFESILLEQPFARLLVKADGTLNLSALALPPAPGVRPEPNAQPARLFIKHFSVQGGNVLFEDRAHPSAFRAEVKPITFDLRNFSTTGQTGSTYALSGTSAAGERFSWGGSLSSNPLASRGQFEVANLQATTVWNYLRDSVHFELPSGVISLSGDYDFTAATAPIGLAVNVHDVTVTDLGVRPKGASEDYVKLARIDVHDTRADVSKRTLAVGSVHLTGGEIRAWVEKPGALNLLELAGPMGSAQPAPATAQTAGSSPDSSPWSVSVPDISLEALKISAEDRQVAPKVSLLLEALSAHVTGFTSPRTAPLEVTMSTQVNRSGQLDVKADLAPDSAMKLQTQLSKLDLTVLQPYIAQRTAMTLRSGLLSTKLNIERGVDGRLAVGGDAEVAQLRTVDNALKRDFIKFAKLQISGIDYKSNPASLHIHSIVAHAPYARVIVESDRTVNVSKVLRLKGASAAPDISGQTSPAETTSAAAAPARPRARNHTRRRGEKSTPALGSAGDGEMAIAIDAVRIQDGSANYVDFWIEPHFAVGIQSLNGSVQGLASNPRARAKVELQGKVDRYAPVHIWGEVNPLAATGYSDIKMSFKGVELTSVTPYSGHFAGYKIEKGKLSVDIGYKIENRRLTAEHRFVIDQLQLGDRVESPDAVKLPLKLAVALLKDRNGVIDVNLPVTGSLDDPQFKLGPLIWKAVLGLLTKIATAPFAALGHLFGGGGEQMKFIDFSPGSAALQPSEHEKLVALGKALKEKTQLELDVPVTYSPDLDRPGLAAARLDERLAAVSREQSGTHRHGKHAPDPDAAATAADPALTDPAQRFRLLLALYRSDQGKEPLPAGAQAIETAGKKAPPPDFAPANAELEAALLPRIAVSDGQLEALGKHRAQAIQDALLGGGEIDPARVFVIGGSPKPAAQQDKVRVELALK